MRPSLVVLPTLLSLATTACEPSHGDVGFVVRDSAGAQIVATAEFLPAHDRHLLVDAEENLWVEDYRSPADDSPPRWSVFDAAGRHLGSVEMPDGFRPTEVGAGFVLGIWTDDLDVQSVRRYGLIKEE